jgi:hypothetical protein
MSIDLPKDRDGRLARECPSGACSPGYFKVRPGTGLQGQQTAFCPYCRHEAPPNDFPTQEQRRYAKDIVMREAQRGISDMMKEAFGLGPSGKRTIGKGGFISMELSYKPGTPRHVRSPYEDEARRDVVCPDCALDQTVFGLATWCADCGADIFLTHVAAEIAVTKLMLDDLERRRESLGRRVATKDLENCLEDAVSIFEASAKALARRRLALMGNDVDAIEAEMKTIRNAFQSVERSKEHLTRLFALSPSDSELWTRMGVCFEKRHPVTHNLGVVDKKYLERTKQNEREGREVHVSADEVANVLADIYAAITDLHQQLIAKEAADQDKTV